MFAGTYPNEVAGLVFVDPTPDFTRTSDDDLSEVFAPIGLGQKERDEMRALGRPPDPTTPGPILAEVAMASAMSAAFFPEIQTLPPSLRRFAAGLAQGTFVETAASSHQIQKSEPELIAWAIDRVLQR